MKTLFVTDPLDGLLRRHRRDGRPDGRLPDRGRRGLGLRARGPRRRRRATDRAGPADRAAAAARAAPTTGGASSRAGTTSAERATLDVARPASWSGCGSTRRSTRATCTRRTCSTWRPRPGSAWSTDPAGVRALHEKLARPGAPRPVPGHAGHQPAAEVEAFVASVRHRGREAGRRLRRHRRVAARARPLLPGTRGVRDGRRAARDRAGVPALGGRRQQAALPASTARSSARCCGDRPTTTSGSARRVAAAPIDAADRRIADGARHRGWSSHGIAIAGARRHRRPADRGQRDLPRRHAQDRRPARHRPQRRDRAPSARHPDASTERNSCHDHHPRSSASP